MRGWRGEEVRSEGFLGEQLDFSEGNKVSKEEGGYILSLERTN